MYYVLVVIVRVVNIALTAFQFLMLARAVMSWLPIEQDGPLAGFLYSVTEPVIMPVRALIEKFEFARNSPIDLSFMATIILLSVIQMLLPRF